MKASKRGGLLLRWSSTCCSGMIGNLSKRSSSCSACCMPGWGRPWAGLTIVAACGCCCCWEAIACPSAGHCSAFGGNIIRSSSCWPLATFPTKPWNWIDTLIYWYHNELTKSVFWFIDIRKCQIKVHLTPHIPAGVAIMKLGCLHMTIFDT